MVTAVGGNKEKKLEKDSIFLGVCPPTTSYEHWDCSDNWVKLQGYRNKLEAVQGPNIHSTGCSLYS